MPVVKWGFSLKTVLVDCNGEEPYEIVRSSRFPCSVFDIRETSEKGRTFQLVSNFAGTRYHLKEEDQVFACIDFEAGACGKYPVRSFSIYYLAPEVTFSNLFKGETAGNKEKDLS